MEAENRRKCRICNVCCSSIVQLCEHVTGNKHKMKLGQALPHQVKRLGTMQLFLDMHMKGEPLLGLEYVVETLEDAVYAYNCQLCDVQGDWRKMVGHVVDTDHMSRYVDKHHGDLSLGEKSYSRKGEHLRALRVVAWKILHSSGRKAIQAIKSDDADDPAIAAGDELPKSDNEEEEKPEIERSPSPESRAALARRKVARKRAPLRSKVDDATAAKVARLSVAARRNGALAAKRALLRERARPAREYDDEREPNWSQSLQEVEFRRNQDLLTYLRNYKIESDGDAHYIQQVIRNCTEALWRFREQQAREESMQSTPLPPPRGQPLLPTPAQHVAPPPSSYSYQGWSRPEAPCFPVNRMGAYASGSSQGPMPRPPSYPIRSPFPPSASAATEIFFNSIKNMEEGEVVNVFHKIAATNPAFRGINIPSVIQYLKDTGRLKP